MHTFELKQQLLKKLLGRTLLALAGWKYKVQVTDEVKRSVMIAAPHTSNWDAPIAFCVFWAMGINLKFFIKDDYTKGPFGWIFKSFGAIGVDRSKKSNKLTDLAIDLLRKNEQLVILVPAEGTRKPVKAWRTGFYRIALETGLPISMGYLDYEKKEAGIAGLFYPTGDFEKDMYFIQETYRPIKGKIPENYNPKIF